MESNISDVNINDTENTEEDFNGNAIHIAVLGSVAVALCLFGMIGNAIVFRHTCFTMKKNKYIVYIINLVVADFIHLVFCAIVMLLYINDEVGVNQKFIGRELLLKVSEIFFNGSRYSGMFFLTAISMERCISAVWTLWYQVHCSRNLSSSLYISLYIFFWIFGFTKSIAENIICSEKEFFYQTDPCTGLRIMVFITDICICLPLMIFSSLILIIKLKKTFRQQYPPRLYIVIIASVIFFVLSVTPIDFLWFLTYFQIVPWDIEKLSLLFVSIYCTILNSSINPYIYFLVGRKWKRKSHSIKDALQRAFNEEDGNT
ncbi:mas-related G-protein coupled receptor member D-like [Pelobates fuscus]|uniref:mas-related G-protein coupled receptor member D-like n=1 Tax=Pelobates fuscus TaxID=191477 RepID=UPI002FE4847E